VFCPHLQIQLAVLSVQARDFVGCMKNDPFIVIPNVVHALANKMNFFEISIVEYQFYFMIALQLQYTQ